MLVYQLVQHNEYDIDQQDDLMIQWVNLGGIRLRMQLDFKI